MLTSPWCLLELYTAATAGIPIVSLVCSGKGYDVAAAQDHLIHLETSLLAASPSAVKVLEDNSAPVLHVAQVLSTCLASTASVPLNSAGSENAIQAAVADLVKAAQRANAVPAPSMDNEAWLEDREARDRAALAEVLESSSTIRGTQRGRMIRRVERVGALECKVAELEATLKASNEKLYKSELSLKSAQARIAELTITRSTQ